MDDLFSRSGGLVPSGASTMSYQGWGQYADPGGLRSLGRKKH